MGSTAQAAMEILAAHLTSIWSPVVKMLPGRRWAALGGSNIVCALMKTSK